MPDRITGDSCDHCGCVLDPEERFLKLSGLCDECEKHESREEAEAQDEWMRAVAE